MKVVINDCHGGFGLSQQAVERYLALKNVQVYTEVSKWGKWGSNEYWLVEPGDHRVKEPTSQQWSEMTLEERQAHNHLWSSQVFYCRNVPRDDAALVQTIEEIGELANGDCARLKIVEIPDDANWYIEEYDGLEHVAERHRTWR
jgi:hypothetical protein